MTRRRHKAPSVAAGLLLAASSGCGGHMPQLAHFDRPSQLVGEWIDVRHTSPGDTALWVLRDNGYDGSEHVGATIAANGVATPVISEHRYGTWYFAGTFADTVHRALCFAKRIGRDGPTCLAFAIDTTSVDGVERRRLTIRGYQGQHYTGDRMLLDRHAATVRK